MIQIPSIIIIFFFIIIIIFMATHRDVWTGRLDSFAPEHAFATQPSYAGDVGRGPECCACMIDSRYLGAAACHSHRRDDVQTAEGQCMASPVL